MRLNGLFLALSLAATSLSTAAAQGNKNYGDAPPDRGSNQQPDYTYDRGLPPPPQQDYDSPPYDPAPYRKPPPPPRVICAVRLPPPFHSTFCDTQQGPVGTSCHCRPNPLRGTKEYDRR